MARLNKEIKAQLEADLLQLIEAEPGLSTSDLGVKLNHKGWSIQLVGDNSRLLRLLHSISKVKCTYGPGSRSAAYWFVN